MGEESQGLRVEKGHVFSLLLSSFDRHWRWKASRKNTAHGCHGLALLRECGGKVVCLLRWKILKLGCSGKTFGPESAPGVRDLHWLHDFDQHHSHRHGNRHAGPELFGRQWLQNTRNKRLRQEKIEGTRYEN